MKWVNNKMNENYKSPYILDEDREGEYLIYHGDGEPQIIDVICEEIYKIEIAACMRLDESDVVTGLEDVRWN
jgi:hypothetical protein